MILLCCRSKYVPELWWPYKLGHICLCIVLSMNTLRFLVLWLVSKDKETWKIFRKQQHRKLNAKEMAFRGGAHRRPGYSHVMKFPGIPFCVFVLDLASLVPSSQTAQLVHSVMNVDVFTVRIGSLIDDIYLLLINHLLTVFLCVKSCFLCINWAEACNAVYKPFWKVHSAAPGPS